MIVLITGGSGCGKSTYAEKLITSFSSTGRVYIATMQVYDEESVRRVEHHRVQRADKGFVTVECPKNLAHVSVEEGNCVLLEDIPNLLANEMFDGGDIDSIVPALKTLSQTCAYLVMVTNDIFSDGVTYPSATQEYIRRLARINCAAAELSDHVIEVVYSIPVMLKGDAPCVY